jgi:CheY-like chemotaxis protein
MIDATSNCKIMSMILKKKNIDSDTAENGFVAVRMVRENYDKYSVIFMDNMMPIMVSQQSTCTLYLLRTSG